MEDQIEISVSPVFGEERSTGQSMNLPTGSEIQHMAAMAEQNSGKSIKELEKILQANNNFTWLKYVISNASSQTLELFCHLALQKIMKDGQLVGRQCRDYFEWSLGLFDVLDDFMFVSVELRSVFAFEIALFYRYQLSQTDCKLFLDKLLKLIENGNKPASKFMIVKTLIEIISIIKTNPSSYEKRSTNNIVNRILFAAFKVYSTIIVPTDDAQNPFIMSYNPQYKDGIIDQISFQVLTLIKECLNFDFFNVKKHKNSQEIESQFLELYSPINIPIKSVHKNQMLINFSIFKNQQLLDQFEFMYNQLDWMPLRITIITIIGDLCRICPKFFMLGPKDVQRSYKKMNEILIWLQRFSSLNLQYNSSSDIPIIIQFGRALKKLVISNKISTMDQDALKNLVINITQFFNNSMFDKKLLSMNLLFPYFDFFQKLQKYQNYPSVPIKSIITSCIKCFKSKFLNTLMDVLDAKKKGDLFQFDAEKEISPIQIEMSEDFLLNSRLLEEYLMVLKTIPIQSMEEQSQNEDIKLLYKYIMFQNSLGEYTNLRKEENKDIMLPKMVRIVQEALDKIYMLSIEDGEERERIDLMIKEREGKSQEDRMNKKRMAVTKYLFPWMLEEIQRGGKQSEFIFDRMFEQKKYFQKMIQAICMKHYKQLVQSTGIFPKNIANLLFYMVPQFLFCQYNHAQVENVIEKLVQKLLSKQNIGVNFENKEHLVLTPYLTDLKNSDIVGSIFSRSAIENEQFQQSKQIQISEIENRSKSRKKVISIVDEIIEEKSENILKSKQKINRKSSPPLDPLQQSKSQNKPQQPLEQQQSRKSSSTKTKRRRQSVIDARETISRNLSYTKKYRLFLNSCVNKIFDILATKECNLCYNRIILELLLCQERDMKVVYGMLVLVNNLKQETEEIRKFILHEIDQAEINKDSQKQLEYIKLLTLISKPQELTGILAANLSNSIPITIAMLEIIHFTSYHILADAVTQWFFGNLYNFALQFVKNIVISQHIHQIGSLTTILALILKINRSRSYDQYKKDYLLKVVDDVMEESLGVLIKKEKIALKENRQIFFYAMEGVIDLSLEVLRMENRIFSIDNINPLYQKMNKKAETIIEMMNVHDQCRDTPQKQKHILQYLQIYLPVVLNKTRFFYNFHIKNLMIQMIPKSIFLITRYTQSPLLQQNQRQQLLKEVIHKTINNVPEQYIKWIGLLKLFKANYQLTQQLSQSEELYRRYFEILWDFEDIHISDFIKIQANLRNIQELKEYKKIQETEDYPITNQNLIEGEPETHIESPQLEIV